MLETCVPRRVRHKVIMLSEGQKWEACGSTAAAAAGSVRLWSFTTGCGLLGACNLAEMGIECSKTFLWGVTLSGTSLVREPCRTLGL